MTSTWPLRARIIWSYRSSRGKPGIHDGYPVPEPPVKPHHRLIGQGDLRDQDDRLLPHIYHRPDHLHVDFCLPASL